MQLQLLPTYFKKIGFTLFALTFWPEAIRGFIDGYNAGAGPTMAQLSELPAEFTFWGINFFSGDFIEVCSILSVVGLMLYALSRDKIVDEFLMQLRMEAVHLTFFISISIIAILLLFNIKTELNALYVIEIQIIIFLIAKKSKKVSAAPSTTESYE